MWMNYNPTAVSVERRELIWRLLRKYIYRIGGWLASELGRWKRFCQLSSLWCQWICTLKTILRISRGFWNIANSLLLDINVFIQYFAIISSTIINIIEYMHMYVVYVYAHVYIFCKHVWLFPKDKILFLHLPVITIRTFALLLWRLATEDLSAPISKNHWSLQKGL